MRSATYSVSCQDGAVQRSGAVEDMQRVVPQTPVPRCCPNTELRERGLGSPDLVVEGAMAGTDDPGPGGGGAEPTCCRSQHREPEDQPAGLRPTVRRGALRWPPVEGHQRRPDPD